MSISKEYQQTLKKRAIQRFVEEHARAPSSTERKVLLGKTFKDYPTVDEVGISGFDIQKILFRDESSAAVENKNRAAILDDLLTQAKKIDNLILHAENSFRGFRATASKTERLLRQIESRLDNLILMRDKSNIFSYGIEETFETQENVDIDRTTASVEANYCTLRRTGYSAIDLSNVSLSASTVSERGVVGTQASNTLEALKELDGSFWEYLVYTKHRRGRVSVALDIEFPEPIFVGDLRLIANPINTNSRSTITLLYSLDAQTFTTLPPEERALSEGENQFSVGIEGIRKIRLLISKNASDTVTTTRNQFVYIFSLDLLEIYSDTYTNDRTSEFVSTAYTILDEEGNPVNFTKVTCEACTTEPENTSVNFFVSKDSNTWIPISHTEDSLQVVSFGRLDRASASDIVDSTLLEQNLVEQIPGIEEIDFPSEAFLNIFIKEDFVDRVPKRNITIKRNIPSSKSVYGIPAGWFFDTSTKRYRTTVYIDALEGRDIDFGPRGVVVNGNLVAGQVHLEPGFSTIETDESNWYELDQNITNINDLKREDPLYPYNHKYLVEGYAYPGSFAGEQVYTGVDEFFGSLLKYVPAELFNSSEQDINIFTTVRVDGNLYFKVKVDKTDSSWQDELFLADWIVQSGADNKLYVKAVLQTSDIKVSPVIHDFKIRVI